MDVRPVQSYLRSALGANAGVTALVGDRIYDLPPPGAAFPYITIGIAAAEEDYISDCAIDWNVVSEIHIWSRTPGYPECKNIGQACNAALANRHPVFTGFRMGWFALVGHRYERDDDGLTSHGILEYRAHYGPL